MGLDLIGTDISHFRGMTDIISARVYRYMV